MTNWLEFAFDLIYLIANLVATLWAIMSFEIDLVVITLSMWQILSGIGVGIILSAAFLKHIVPLV